MGRFEVKGNISGILSLPQSSRTMSTLLALRPGIIAAMLLTYMHFTVHTPYLTLHSLHVTVHTSHVIH